MSPTLAFHEGMVLELRLRDEHPPAHVHVSYDEAEMRILLPSFEIVSHDEYSEDLPTNKLKALRKWLEDGKNKKILVDGWNARLGNAHGYVRF